MAELCSSVVPLACFQRQFSVACTLASARIGFPPSTFMDTESVLLSNAKVTLSVLQELRARGLRLAIDDFGTGYSSFSYLRQYQVNKLKIDRSFVRDIVSNPDDAAIATAIIRMAKALNLEVIAEGVETEEQVSFLRALQCDEIQGYYLAGPYQWIKLPTSCVRNL